MLAVIIAFPIFLLLVILQSSIVSATPLLRGVADLVLLTIIAWALQERNRAVWQWTLIGSGMVSILSKSPMLVTIVGYVLVTGMVLYTRKILWTAPYLAMGMMTLVGTLIIHGITMVARWFDGAEIAFSQAFNLVILPSLLLNLLIAIPILALIRDLASWLYPVEVNV